MAVFPKSLKSRLKSAADPRIAWSVRRSLPVLAPDLMQFGQYWPHDHEASSFSRPIGASQSGIGPSSALPLPPREFWAHYCTSEESFLRSGREDCETMRRLLVEAGAPIESAGRILDLGCAGGRMIRWLADLAPETQLWGTDIWSSAILWCQDHLSPPCNFATTTMVPHLPFEDRSFGLVYCGSLFTHIDDLVETWFLELHRILRPGGRLYFSVNDRHAVNIFEGSGEPGSYAWFYERTGGKDSWDEFVGLLKSNEDYLRFRRGDAYMFTMGPVCQHGMRHLLPDNQ